MSLVSFIMSFGYIAVLIGAIFEGETVLILAGFAVHEGYLKLPIVFVCAFCGAMIGDAFFFFLGRYKGEAVLKKLPWLQNMTLKPQQFITRNAVLFAFVLRFMYGFRHIVPFSVGISPIPVPVFLLFNALGAAVWVLVFGLGGYLFGDLLEVFLGDLKRYEFKIIVITVILVVLTHLLFKGVKCISRKMIR